MKGINDCKRTSNDSKNEDLAGECFAKEIMKVGSGSSLPGAVMYRRDARSVLRIQMAMSSSQGKSFSSQDDPKGMRHSVHTLHLQKSQRRVREKMMAWKSSDLW